MLGKREQARLRFLVISSRTALVFETALPYLLLPAALPALYALASWFGFWESLPASVHVFVLVALFFAWLASLVPLARRPYPLEKDAIARLDRQVPHRVVASLSDRLVMRNPEAAELWQLHQRRLAAQLQQIGLYRPHPNIFRRDRYGMRFLFLLLLAVGAVAAGPERLARLQRAFDGSSASLLAPRLDAWVTPPSYTGRPPVFLDMKGQDARAIHLVVPQGSVFTLRTETGQGIELKIADRLVKLSNGARDDSKLLRFEEKLEKSGAFVIQHYGRALAEGDITVEPDLAPDITLEGPVQILLGKSLRVRAKVQDDYGVLGAKALFHFAERKESTVDLRPDKNRMPQPLVEDPGFPLVLGLTRPRDTVTTTTKDISSHPFAGLPMLMQLIARDDAGNEAKADAGRLVLPARPFANPLARALAALRQKLALDRAERSAVGHALELLVAEPEKHIPDLHHYLQITAVQAQLDNAWNDDDLRAVLDRLWDVAVFIEEGDLSDAERALAEAQRRLEDALDRNASPEEISKLMNELRRTMANYLRQLQNQAAKNAPGGKLPPNMKVLTEADLERMMKRIEQLSRSGAREAARQQLQNLRDLLSALRNSDPSSAGAASALQKRLEDIAGLMHEQQKLMDETFKERNRQRQQGREAPSGPQQKAAPPSAGAKELEQKQGQLRDKLRELQQGLQESETGKPLGDAEGAMGEAEQYLGHNIPGQALPEQGRALEEMRKGAQALMRSMQGGGQGEGGSYGFNTGEGNGDLDAPGRYNPFSAGESMEDGNRVPDEIDRKTIQDILDEVKRRLSDPQRPKQERDYLERLLRPF